MDHLQRAASLARGVCAMPPEVTVGIPFLNNEETLLDAVRSVFAQTLTDWELILVDDGSTDGSFECVSRIVDPRVRILRDGKNLKLPARLNQIAQVASGHYLARMDADDLMHPDRLARQVAYLKAYPECDVLGASRYAIDVNDNVSGMARYPGGQASPERLLSHAILCHPTVMAKADWFRANPYSTQYPRAEDHELWVRSVGSYTIRSLDEPLLFFREVGAVTVDKYRASARDTRSIIRTHGLAYVGQWTLVSMLAGSHAKEWVYRLLGAVGLADLAVRRRNVSLSSAQMRSAEAIIRHIKATPIPLQAE